LAAIAAGIVVLFALAAWAFAMKDGNEGGSTPGGPGAATGSPSQPAQTGPSAVGATQPGDPTIQLTATSGPDSRRVLVQGSQFGSNEEVVLSIDGTEAKRLNTDSSGAFTASLTVPFSKSSFVVRADGATSNRSASGTVTF
jgi:hypothetical protein